MRQVWGQSYTGVSFFFSWLIRCPYGKIRGSQGFWAKAVARGETSSPPPLLRGSGCFIALATQFCFGFETGFQVDNPKHGLGVRVTCLALCIRGPQ